MKISEYSKNRAESILRLNFSSTQMPFIIEWIEIVNSDDRLNSIYIGNHSHSFYEIHYVFNGNVSYIINNKTYCVNEGEALIIPPKTQHRYSTGSNNFIKTSLAVSVASEHNFSLNECIRFNFEDSISENVNYILKHAQNLTAFSNDIIAGKIAEILDSTLLTLGFDMDSSANLKDKRIYKAIKFIEDNINLPIKSEDVARESYLSIKQLDRIFKKETNLSIHNFIIETKIKFAKKLIKNSDYSFKEIASKLGFKHESYFTIFFKKHTGMTPGAYRKTN